jgi:hypothetical protein
MNKQVGYIAPRDFGWLEKLKGLERKPGVTVVKGADGGRLMFIVTSNSYKDREAEFITTDALTRYVEKSWIAEDVCKTDNVLKFWHDDPSLPLPDIGEIIWADMEGPFLIEVGKEASNSWAKAVFDYREAHPDEKWGASHGFYFEEKRINPAKGEATYDAIEKFETSILPLSAAANAYTFSGVVSMKSRNDVIDKILGEVGAATKLRAGVQDEQKRLDAAGLERKALAQKGALEKLSDLVEGFIAKLTDQPVAPETKQEFISLITTMLTPATEEPVVEETALVGEEPDMMKSVKLMDTLIETQGAIVDKLAALDAAYKSLEPLNALATALNGVRAEISGVKADINLLKVASAGKPRIASKDDSTAVLTSDEEKRMVAKATEQLSTLDTFWRA